MKFPSKKVKQMRRRRDKRRRQLTVETLERRDLLTTVYIDVDNGSDASDERPQVAASSTIQAGAISALPSDKGGELHDEARDYAQNDILNIDDAGQTSVNAMAFTPAHSVPSQPTGFKLELPGGFPHCLSLPVNLLGETVTLELDKYDIRGENYRVVLHQADGSYVEAVTGEVNTYRGRLAEQPGVYLGGALLNGRLHVRAANAYTGEPLWQLSPADDGVGYEIKFPESNNGGEDPAVASDHNLAGYQSVTTPLIAELNSLAGGSSGVLTRMPESPPIAAAPPNAMLVNTVQVRRAEIAFDVSFQSYSQSYGSSVSSVSSAIDAFVLDMLNGIWLRDALIAHELGEIVIRTSAATDPYTSFVGEDGTSDGRLEAFQTLWESGVHGTDHDLAHLISGTLEGGLAWNGTAGGNNSFRYSQAGGSAGSWRGFARHEVGHTWGLSHSEGDTQYFSPINLSLPTGQPPGPAYGIMAGSVVGAGPFSSAGPTHAALAPNEQAIVTARRDAVLSSLDTVNLDNAPNIRPYAKIDNFTVVGSGMFMLDVLSNDFDANNDSLYISSAGKRFETSFTLASGSALAIGDGLGLGGRDVLLYTPGIGITDEVVFYWINDGQLDMPGQVNVTAKAPLSVDPGLTEYLYDFGTKDSPVFDDGSDVYQRLTEDDFGDIHYLVNGQPPQPGVINALDRGAGADDLYRDYIYSSSPVTFNHQIANGTWEVALNMGDLNLQHDNQGIRAEGVLIDDDIDAVVGQFPGRSFEVIVTDGELNLEFFSNGGGDANWVLNRIALTKVRSVPEPDLPGDFNRDYVVDSADFTIWRDRLGDTVLAYSSADANGDGIVDQADRAIWMANFGISRAPVTLIDSTVGNGSFEDWGAQDSMTRILATNSAAAIPGWVAVTTSTGGWLRESDSAATSGAAADGTAYALAAGGSTITLTSLPLTTHTTVVGDKFVVSLDVGFNSGSEGSYIVSLIFNGQKRIVSTFTDGADVTTKGTIRREVSYIATAADAGYVPTVEITMMAGGSFSQAYVDNIEVSVLEAVFEGDLRPILIPFGASVGIQGDSYGNDGPDWPNLLQDVNLAYNDSVPGRRLSSMVGDLQGHIDANPSTKHFAVMGGVNDASGRDTTQELIGTAKDLLAIADANPGVVLILQTIPPWANATTWTEAKGDAGDGFDTWLRAEGERRARGRRNLIVFDLRHVLDADNDRAMDPEWDVGDGLHPNHTGGHQLIADRFEEYCVRIAPVTLIDATLGNGSFEDWGAQGSSTRVLATNSSVSISGWDAVTTSTGGWLREGDSAATAGAAADGTAYALAAGGSMITLTSAPLTTHTTVAGDEFVISLDVGFKNGSEGNYAVSLIFDGQERVVGTFTDRSDVTVEGTTRHELEYVATASDAGRVPTVKIVAMAGSSFSQAYVDDIEVVVFEGDLDAPFNQLGAEADAFMVFPHA